MKLLIITLSVFSLLISSAQRRSDTISSETIEEIEKSIVPILCIRLNEKNEIQERITIGTGFFINRDGDLLTAAHVVTEIPKLKTLKQCISAIWVASSEWKNRYRDVDIPLMWYGELDCHYRQGVDIAVCRAKINPFLDRNANKSIQPVTFTSLSKFRDGSPVAFTGFPLQYVYPITSKGYIASYDPSTKKLIIDKTAWPGASGSPVYTTDGKVIGILIEKGTDNGAGLAFARPTDLAFDLLREQKISFADPAK